MRSIRTFVFLLIAIFLADGVFAETAMASAIHQQGEAHHCHEMAVNQTQADQADLLTHSNHKHHAQHQCNNCFACMTMLPMYLHVANIHVVLAPASSTYFIEYVSPAIPLSDRPPIYTSLMT